MRLIDADNMRKASRGIFIYQDEFEDDVQHIACEAYTKEDIENERTIEAIPIEWLMKKADEWATKDITYDGKPFTAQQVGLAIASMVIDWEKENE